MKFSFYKKGIKNTKPSKLMSIEEAVALIRSDAYADAIANLRAAENKDVRSVLKSYLDYFTFSGEFKLRNEAGLMKHSGLLCLDFDNIDDVEQRKKAFCLNPFVLACFISPSGKGLKVLLRIDETKHLESFTMAKVFFELHQKISADASGKDVCRACFVSHDPEAYYNAGAALFSLGEEKAPKPHRRTAPNGELIKPLVAFSANHSEADRQQLEDEV